MGTQASRNLLGHDGDGKRAMRYEDRNAALSAADAVTLARNNATSITYEKPPPVYPWANSPTNLLHPGTLGPTGTPRHVRVLNLVNMWINDATGVAFPRDGALDEKLKFCYDTIKQVTECFPHPRVGL